ncbi:hypothetical protein ACFP56_00795 [Paenibacillus septentrionalis]|uniref:Uncharacterized protein n=1 Tax=Paenibacillus septentrionalis TaxID=429342 RepID=A0ABW1UZN1_9BACL
MYGNWRWNLGFGLFGLLIVFIIGLTNNPWAVSLLRGFYACIAFFLLAYPLRYIIGLLLASDNDHAETIHSMEEPSLAGTNVDYVTPEGEEDLNEMLRKQMAPGEPKSDVKPPTAENDPKAEQFQPLKPTRLVSTENMQAADLTKAVRHLTGE